MFVGAVREPPLQLGLVLRLARQQGAAPARYSLRDVADRRQHVRSVSVHFGALPPAGPQCTAGRLVHGHARESPFGRIRYGPFCGSDSLANTHGPR